MDQKIKKMLLRFLLTLAVTLAVIANAADTTTTCPPPLNKLSTMSWNLAAINNNPFEYHMGDGTGTTTTTTTTTTSQVSTSHNQLMSEVANFLTKKNNNDPYLSDLFPPYMVEDLLRRMESSLHYDNRQVNVVRQLWYQDYSKRRSISNFIHDVDLGKKRLLSYPDRMTNTIRVEGVIGSGRGTGHHEGTTHPRPTVINCYNGSKIHFQTLPRWWQEWTRFMFDDLVEVSTSSSSSGSGSGKKGKEKEMTTTTTRHVHPHQLLRPISRLKYPALTVEEEAVSLPLQTLTLALFDLVLMWIMITIRPDGSWHENRVKICQQLVWNKSQRSRSLLETTYQHHDLLFLQEISEKFIFDIIHQSTNFRILIPPDSDDGGVTFDGGRNQNSVVLVRRGGPLDVVGTVENGGRGWTARDITSEIYVHGASHGDIYAVLMIPPKECLKRTESRL